MLPEKQERIFVVFTNHVRQRMRERLFSEADVQLILDYGEREILEKGDLRYTLTDRVPEELKDDILFRYNRNRKVILTPDHILKTVISNDEVLCDFETFRNFVEVS